MPFTAFIFAPEPRIAASRWIFQNIPGPINMQIETGQDGTYNQPLPFPTGVNIQPSMPYQTSFTAQSDGVLKEILLAHVAAYPEEVPSQLHLSVLQNPNDAQPLASTFTNSSQDVLTALSQTATFDPQPALAANQTYYLKFEMTSPEGRVNICGPMSISINTGNQTSDQTVDASEPCTVTVDSSLHPSLRSPGGRDTVANRFGAYGKSGCSRNTRAKTLSLLLSNGTQPDGRANDCQGFRSGNL